jgi:hypothetical protein
VVRMASSLRQARVHASTPSTLSCRTMSKPNLHENPKGWERYWETTLGALYGPRAPRHIFEEITAMVAELPTDKASLVTFTDEISRLQHDLAKRAVEELVVEGFEEKWLALPSARREELLLDALVKTSAIDEEMELRRYWCPELTVRALNSKGGREYVKLMKALLPSQGIEVLSPIHVENRLVLDALKLNRHDLNIKYPTSNVHSLWFGRTYLISLVVWFTLLGFVSAFILRSCVGLTIVYLVWAIRDSSSNGPQTSPNQSAEGVARRTGTTDGQACGNRPCSRDGSGSAQPT